ncbi:hypothetical protein FGRMN_6103 [Fusarium graminum]|nr:hypothetical protein FGRMN_6103 [Fusarium graminum]
MVYRSVSIIFFFATVLLYTLVVMRISTRNLVESQHHTTAPSKDPHLNSKLAHAEKLWKRSIEDRKEMVKRSGYDKKFPDGYINPFTIWDFTRPSFFCPHDLERVGKLGDGGKIVCGMTRYEKESPGPSATSNPARELIVYSFGVDDDSSFEAELLQRTNARIWGYDSHVKSWAKQIAEYQYPRATFKKAMIGKISDSKAYPPVLTIQDIMKMNGHSYVDLVKMDIEGAEFETLTSLIDSIVSLEKETGNSTLPFGQLLIEFHLMTIPPEGVTLPKNLKSWLKWWSSLEAMGLRPVSNEHNWIGNRVYCAPRFIEYTFINVRDRERNVLLQA